MAFFKNKQLFNDFQLKLLVQPKLNWPSGGMSVRPLKCRALMSLLSLPAKRVGAVRSAHDRAQQSEMRNVVPAVQIPHTKINTIEAKPAESRT